MALDKTELRLKRIEVEEAERASSASRPLILILMLIGAGVGASFYFTAKEDKPNVAENGVYLPDILITKASAARGDLALLDRELHELAIEADKKLSKSPGPANKERGEKYLTRIADFRETGHELEPKLSHEERRVLIATEHAERLVEAFIRSSYDEQTFDHTLIERARRQIARAQALATGAPLDTISDSDVAPSKLAGDLKSISESVKEIKGVKNSVMGGGGIANADHPGAGGIAGELKSVASGLQAIKGARANEAIPDDVGYVPEIDGPRKAKPAKKKAAEE